MNDLRRIIVKIFEIGKFVRLGLRRQWWSLILIGKTKSIKVHAKDTFNFKCYGDVTRLLYTREPYVTSLKSFEYNSISEFISLLKSTKVVLDVGANIGIYSLIASKYLGSKGEIFAFEPSLKTFEVLSENLKLNNSDNVKPLNIGLSDKQGVAALIKPKEVEEHGIEGDSLNYLDYSKLNSDNNIKLSTIDDIVSEYGIKQVDLIKIDIEGAELLCLEGAKMLLSTANRPIIFMECSDLLAHRFDTTIFETLNYLHSFGYKFKQFEYGMWVATPC